MSLALIGWVLPLFLGAALAGPVSAGAPTDQLRAAFAEVNRVLGAPELEARPEERLHSIQQIAYRLFDVAEAARAALGSQWQARTAPEQQEFAQLFGALLVRGYLFRVAGSATLQGEGSIAYLGEAVEGDEATVDTAMESRLGGTVACVYRMLRRGQGWVVTDVVMDGVSLVANYKAQFARVIQASSYRKLVALMRAKTSPEDVAPAMAGRPAVVAISGPPPHAAVAAASPAAADADPSPRTPAMSVAVLRPAVRRAEPIAATPDTARAVPVAVATRPAPDPPRPVVTVAAPAPAAVPAALLTPPATYWVQVGAFTNAENAQRLVARLKQEHFPATHLGGAGLTRVRVGPLADRAQALATLRQLEAKGYRPFLAEASN